MCMEQEKSPMVLRKKTILFVCTGNAGRSQIAQSLFSRLAGNDVSAVSAGVDPWKQLHPVAVRLLRERGVDTAGLHPKHVRSFTGKPLDWMVTIGDRAHAETLRMDGNPKRVHWDIADPADADGTGKEDAVFRHAMAEIETRLPSLLAAMRTGSDASSLHFAPGLSTVGARRRCDSKTLSA